jgi:endothelin-converting enzyme/putative endopeptidase
MRQTIRTVLFGVCLAVPAFGQSTTSRPDPASSSTGGSAGFDLSQLDRSADPCVDFYQFACGGWRRKNPLPDDKSRWGRYDEMAERNREKLRVLLEDAGRPGAARTPLERQVGDYYAACMDESLANRKGAAPLQPFFDRIAGIRSSAELVRVVATLHGDGATALFDFGSQPDLRNANQVIAYVDQGGLGLPDRDYYLKTDPKNVERRARYREHVQKMFVLAGRSGPAAAAAAATVLSIETELAKASMDRTARRDPANLDHKMTRATLVAGVPHLELAAYFDATGAPAFDELNNANPGFFEAVNGLIDRLPLDQWQTYLDWRVVRWAAPRLSEPFVDEDFRFNGQYMRGVKVREARWKTCVRQIDRDLGEASGKLFVERYFGPEGKERMRTLVDNVVAALEESIREVDWMSDATRQKALAKLAKIRTAKLGFPETYRDYSSIRIDRDDFLGNTVRSAQFEAHRTYAKIGKPLDRTEWGMTPPTVNAYYDPQAAEIVFPAGMLQPPMFDLTADDAYSYGAIGRVVGHELTHGFDDEGRKFDADGNLTDWWTPADATAFEARASCIEHQYGEYSPVSDAAGQPIYLKGKLTLGENTADNGGLRMAYRAYMKSLEHGERKVVDGFTPEQRFFIGYGVSRCENVTDDLSRMLVDIDPHSPGRFRLIGAVSNMPEFWKAFSCAPGQAMMRGENACRVW